MIPESEQRELVRIGLLNETLGVRRGAGESEPVIATARDIGELLIGFQQAVYATYALQHRWDTVKRLRRADRERFALQIVGYQQDSFLTLLTAGPGLDVTTMLNLVMQTIQTLTGFAALALAYKSLRLQQSSTQEARMLELMKGPAGVLGGVSLRTNHVVSINAGMFHFSTTFETSLALQQYSDAERQHPAPRTRDIPQFEFAEEDMYGIVRVSSSDDGHLRIYSPQYDEVIRCSYGPDYQGPRDSMRVGATVSLRGLATRTKGDSPHSSPLLFQIEELLQVTYGQ